MELTKRFWDEKGYQNLERTAQNLRDKIGHIEKSSQTAAVLIDSEIDEQRLQLINAEEQSEQHTVMSNNNEALPNINTERTSDTTFQSLNTSLMLRHNQQRTKTLSSHCLAT